MGFRRTHCAIYYVYHTIFYHGSAPEFLPAFYRKIILTGFRVS